ncbi:hypothetical protein BH09ACT7_BH09ACT7_44810 [soil metagenome]
MRVLHLTADTPKAALAQPENPTEQQQCTHENTWSATNARGLQDAGAPVNITYPGMVLGPPAGDQFGEVAEGVEAAVKMHGVPGRGAAWIVVDVRDLADLHVALLEPSKGPRRYMAGGRRIPVDELASLIGSAAERGLVVIPVPDVALRALGGLFDVIHRSAARWPRRLRSTPSPTCSPDSTPSIFSGLLRQARSPRHVCKAVARVQRAAMTASR